MIDRANDFARHAFVGELNLLFYQRSLICLWLGVIFFTLFSLLDYICYPHHFALFGLYRFLFVLALLCILLLLQHPLGKRLVRPIMFAAMLLGSMTISLMTLKLGGFVSGYYVGILLMMAGGFSVLPFTVFQALFTGLSMYLVYAATVWYGTGAPDQHAWRYAMNNTFFFACITGVTAIQSFDDLRIQRKALAAQRGLRTLKNELKKYTGNLEELVKKRVQQVRESELRFQDLYNNIDELIVVIDGQGRIQGGNWSAEQLLAAKEGILAGMELHLFLPDEASAKAAARLLERLEEGETVRGLQLRLLAGDGRTLEAEVSGMEVPMPGEKTSYQLIIRDISSTKQVEKQVLESSRLLDSSRQAAIFGLAHLAECRDEETGAHLQRIREYTRLLTEVVVQEPEIRPFISDSFEEDIYRSAVLHDIGKVAIPDEILLKPGKLSAEEMAVMHAHCSLGSEVLHNAEQLSGTHSFLTMGQDISHFHHERWDGTGYPEQLAGEEIPLAARIVALADVYDALTTRRVYKPAFTHEEAKEYIVNRSGTHFDPLVVKAFLHQEAEFQRVRKNLLLNG